MGEKRQFLEGTANLQETQRNIGDLRDTQQQGVIPIKASSLSLLPIPLEGEQGQGISPKAGLGAACTKGNSF